MYLLLMTVPTPLASLQVSTTSLCEFMRQWAIQTFSRRPCDWQCEVPEALLRGDDVICIAPTGAGKTLSFWLLLSARPRSIIVVIIPLNLLGDQNAERLVALGIPAININAGTKNLDDEIFVRSHNCECSALADTKYS